ncbi:MAG: GTPase [Planctomycetota bacterium]
MPHVVQLTPPGRGAIATLLVEGAEATKLVEGRFRPAGGRPLGSYPVGRIVFGYFSVGSHPREEVVVCRRSAGAVEVHCHGGHVAAARIREAFLEAGARALAWQEWAAGHSADPIAAAACVALANARTERTAAVLLDQYHGALLLAVEEIRRLIQAGDAASAVGQLATLLARAELGRHLVDPWRVILAGSPNVGKSSLINALLGYERAIVHPTAGTTRDVVSATTAIEGWPVELSDTAGLREARGGLERAAVEMARRQLASADLVLLVFDSSRPWTDGDQRLVDAHPNALVIHNKRDLPSCPTPPRPAGLWTSALTGQGIEDLVGLIANRLVPDPPPRGAAVPFSADQINHLREAAAAASRHDLPAALAAIEDLLA